MARVLVYYAIAGERQPPKEFKADRMTEAGRAAADWCREQEARDDFAFLGAGAEQSINQQREDSR